MNILTNDFVKPEGQRELARFGLARNRTFKNVSDKREQRKLAYSAERRKGRMKFNVFRVPKSSLQA